MQSLIIRLLLIILLLQECVAFNRIPVRLSPRQSAVTMKYNIHKTVPAFLTAAALTLSIMPPTSSFAVTTNPDAIDIKRVMQEPAQAPGPGAIKYQVLPNGVQYQDAVLGTGASADEGKSVQFQWVMRRQNGYFIDASSNYGSEPFIYKVGNTKKVIPGLDSAIRGMKVGGVRRIVVPPQLAYVAGVEDDAPGPVPNDYGARRQIINIQNTKQTGGAQTVYFEVKLVRVK